MKTVLLTNDKELIRKLEKLKSNITIIKNIRDMSNASNIIIDRKCGITSSEITSLKRKYLNADIKVVLDNNELTLIVLELIVRNLKIVKAKKLFNMMTDKATTVNEKGIATKFLIRELAQ